MAAQAIGNAITVRSLWDPARMMAVILPQDEPLRSTISQFASDPSLRAIFLVDSHQRFAGAINRHDLLKWARVQLGGRGVAGSGVPDFLHHLAATKARDIAQGDWRSLGVKPEDPIDRALDHMLSFDLTAIPVLDHDGKVLGDIRLSQVLSAILERTDGAGA